MLEKPNQLIELKLSVSKTKTFLDCKKKFNFTYIQHLPRKTWQHHTTGKFCHKVLENFHNAYLRENSTLPFHAEMTKAFKAAMAEYKDQMTPEMKKECREIMNNYLKEISLNKNSPLAANVIDVEKGFSFLIDDNIILNGAIDRIQLDADNVVHVADYKTTKDKRYLQNDWFQLLTYSYVILTEAPDLEKIRASYILLRHNFEYITTEFQAADILKIKDQYREYARQIRMEEEYPANLSRLCRFCDFTNNCEEFRNSIYNEHTIFGEVGY